MEKTQLTAERRTVSGKQVRHLRKQGLIPAVLYGHGLDPVPLQIKERELAKVLAQAGTHRLINLEVNGESKNVLVKEIQKDLIKGNLLHVDLYVVVMTEKIRTKVPLVFTGTSPVVVRKEGILVHGIGEVEIECLPQDLIESIPVDLSRLIEIEQEIKVEDLVVDPDIEILSSEEEMVAKVLPVVEEKIEEVIPAPAAAEVEVIAKGKEEEEAPAEEEE